jgi:hypothetical protein
MNQRICIMFAASLCILLGATTSHAQQEVFTDATGQIQTTIFYGFSARAAHPTLTIPVGGDWVVIGGGGYTDWQSHGTTGNLLTASHPDPYFSSWTIAAKDHLISDPCIIYGYAVAIRVQGLTRAQLLGYMQQTTAASPYVSHPNTISYLGNGYTLLGCGFLNSYQEPGNLAVASYPVNNTGCYAEGKDHGLYSPSTMYSYAIGIRSYIPGVGNLVNIIQSGLSGYSAWPEASAVVPYGYALTGGGAAAIYSGSGQLLWKNMPMANGGWSAGSKDHYFSDPGYVRAYAIGIKAQ